MKKKNQISWLSIIGGVAITLVGIGALVVILSITPKKTTTMPTNSPAAISTPVSK